MTGSGMVAGGNELSAASFDSVATAGDDVSGLTVDLSKGDATPAKSANSANRWGPAGVGLTELATLAGGVFAALHLIAAHGSKASALTAPSPRHRGGAIRPPRFRGEAGAPTRAPQVHPRYAALSRRPGAHRGLSDKLQRDGTSGPAVPATMSLAEQPAADQGKPMPHLEAATFRWRSAASG